MDGCGRVGSGPDRVQRLAEYSAFRLALLAQCAFDVLD